MNDIPNERKDLEAVVSSALSILGDAVDQTDEARAVLTRNIGAFINGYRADRKRLLSREDKDLLISGIAQVRARWESSGGDNWIYDVVANGYTGWSELSDEAIIANAFGEHCCIDFLETELERIQVARLLARPEVVQVLEERGYLSSAEQLRDLNERLDQALDCMLDSPLLAEATRLRAITAALLPKPAAPDLPDSAAESPGP